MVRGSPIICSSKTNSLGDDLVVATWFRIRTKTKFYNDNIIIDMGGAKHFVFMQAS